MSGLAPPELGVVLVTYNSAGVILDCLESLLAARGVRLRVVLVDNASADGTPGLLRDWAAGRHDWAPSGLPFALGPVAKPVAIGDAVGGAGSGHGLTLIETGENGGFAGGVNRGIAALDAAPDGGPDRIWLLNPDTVVPPGTAAAFATAPEPAGGFSVMSGRVTYLAPPDRIQIDGGTLDRRTGVTGNINLGRPLAATPPPDAGDLDFVMGGSMVVSRAFRRQAGPMPEEYFLYYEEVDWALRRGGLPLAYCPEARVHHRAGTAIGSPAPGRPASPFSLYFKHRSRIRFVRRHLPRSLPMALAYSLAKSAQLRLAGHREEARAVIAGSFGRAPAQAIRAQLSPEAARRAFGWDRANAATSSPSGAELDAARQRGGSGHASRR
ncbi:glycosyltransferase family 2 protein [Limimaricola sp.]|uniref:glycosyltransferase family 2 protein n=1 Tax=Limimaricola sp. TaxID=2211665 RepID=UPI00405801B6